MSSWSRLSLLLLFCAVAAASVLGGFIAAAVVDAAEVEGVAYYMIGIVIATSVRGGFISVLGGFIADAVVDVISNLCKKLSSVAVDAISVAAVSIVIVVSAAVADVAVVADVAAVVDVAVAIVVADVVAAVAVVFAVHKNQVIKQQLVVQLYHRLFLMTNVAMNDEQIYVL